MKLSIASLTALALGAVRVAAAPSPNGVELVPRANPTLYICGDSTLAKNGANNGNSDGWGNMISKYVTIPVVNNAIGGRSARSYWNEGRFKATADKVKAGDIVVIEFGHNDGGSPTSNDNGRSDCPGSGTEVCISDKTGEKVYTFVFYVAQAAKLMTAKGATVVLSSQTPNNQWETGTFNSAAPRFVAYQAAAQKSINSPSVTYVDHFQAVTNMYRKLGAAKVNAFFPDDHTHTTAAGADAVAQAFAQAVAQKLNGETSLAPYIKTPVKIVY